MGVGGVEAPDTANLLVESACKIIREANDCVLCVRVIGVTMRRRSSPIALYSYVLTVSARTGRDS
jgi:hypothetical protein